jgi:hypothetical protein
MEDWKPMPKYVILPNVGMTIIRYHVPIRYARRSTTINSKDFK